MDFVVLNCDNDFKITACTKEHQYGLEVYRGTYEACNFYLNCILLYYIILSNDRTFQF